MNIQRVTLILALGLMSAGPLPATTQHKTPTGRPNVILILVDDLGYETLGAYGCTSYATPRLDRMARSGVRFEYCFAQPLCTPSRVQIMTGQYNHRNYTKWGTLPVGQKTFGHMMQAAGYSTGIAGKWQLSGEGVTPRMAGFAESSMWAYGFDLERIGFRLKLPKGAPHNYYYNPKKPSDRYDVIDADRPHMTSRYWQPCIVQNETTFLATTADQYGPDVNCDFVLDFVTRHRGEPFFLYWPMILTHGPNEPTPEVPDIQSKPLAAKMKHSNANFKYMVQHVDRLVGRLQDKLRELGLEENTLLIFSGDNGTMKGVTTRTAHGDIRGGKGATTDAGMRVPLLVQWKGTAAAGTVCGDLVDFTDFLPTIAEAAGAKLPAGPNLTLDGSSFLPQVRGKKGNPRDWVFCHFDKNPEQAAFNPKFPRARYARDKQFKLYDNGKLYDVASDPLEEKPIAAGQESPAAKAARRALQKVLDAMPVKADFYGQGGVTRENNLSPAVPKKKGKAKAKRLQHEDESQ